MQTGSFKITNIVHLTDVHLCRNKNDLVYGRNPYYSFREILNLIHKKIPELSLIVITGDISEDVTLSSYEIADSLLNEFKNTCYWITGNHDDFSILPSKIKNKYIKNEWELGAWKFIALDTTIKGEDYGLLSNLELQKLNSFLSTNKEHPVIICMHHPPIDVDSVFIDSIGLINKKCFWNELANYSNVKAVLSGHVHQQITANVEGILVSCAPSTFVQWLPKSKEFVFDEDRGNGFNLITLMGNEGMTIETIRNNHKSR